MATTEEAKVLMEEGWQSRENHDFETAEEKLQTARTVFHDSGAYWEETEALNHLAYNEKLQAMQHAQKALDLAMESVEIAEEKGTEAGSAYRAVVSTAESLGLFETALTYANKMLEATTKAAIKGDLLSHIATLEMRTGKLDQAKDTIEQAIALIQDGWESEREPHRTIWHLRALIANALITYNRGNRDGALEILENAKTRVEGREDVKSRVQQIEMLLKYL